jgi:5-methylcytosine-specific restriction endonuclease McrA
MPRGIYDHYKIKGLHPKSEWKKGEIPKGSVLFKKGHITWCKGKKLPKEMVDRHREFMIGKKYALGKYHKNPPITEEHRKRLSESRKGMKFSDEHKRNLTISQTGKHNGNKNPGYIDGRMENKDYVSWMKNKRNRDKIEGHTFGEWKLLKKQNNYICPCCKKSEPKIKLTEDHIIPLSKGGSDSIDNIQPLCRHCNFVKHTRIIRYGNTLQANNSRARREY